MGANVRVTKGLPRAMSQPPVSEQARSIPPKACDLKGFPPFEGADGQRGDH
jgi:hypothetical protein